MLTKFFGTIVFIAGLGLLLFAIFTGRADLETPLIFSPENMLSALWHDYKLTYWDALTGRTLDRQRDNITTSEGQSYTLLRAVWMDDKIVFDKTWEWTRDNLQRKEDNLFSWLYGADEIGATGKVLTSLGGNNTASDADTDIALALAFAYARWQNPEYLSAAQRIINDIWDKEVIVVQGKPVLLANNVEKTSKEREAVVNPSYFTPYAYRIFARLNPEHNWLELLDSSYLLISQGSTLSLDQASSSGLPPDWLLLDKQTGSVRGTSFNDLSSDYSFEALRLPWRLALDWQWHRDPRALNLLLQFGHLKDEWENNQKIAGSYTHDGNPTVDYETPAMYGGSLGYFMVSDAVQAKEIYRKKLLILYNPDVLGWKQNLSYYDDNWAWFGLALYNRSLYNLAPDNPADLSLSRLNLTTYIP